MKKVEIEQINTDIEELTEEIKQIKKGIQTEKEKLEKLNIGGITMTQEELDKEIQEQTEIIEKAIKKKMELEALKKGQKQKFFTEKYAPIYFQYESIINTIPKTLLEYETMENTFDFIQRFENFIERFVKTLTEERIPCEKIQLSSKLGVLANENFTNMLKEQITEAKNNPKKYDFPKFYLEILDGIENKTSKTHIPLSLNICSKETGTDYVSITDFNDEKVNHLANITLSGVVNLEQFLYTMQFLGYDIEISNYGKCKNMDDYKQVFKENVLTSTLNINIAPEKIKSFKAEPEAKAR